MEYPAPVGDGLTHRHHHHKYHRNHHLPDNTPQTTIIKERRKMPHRTRPMAALLVFTGLNAVLLSSISPVYDFVCFHPYWERRREHRCQEREAAALTKSSASA